MRPPGSVAESPRFMSPAVGDCYVDADELFASPDVQDTIRKMEKLDVTRRSSGPAGTD